MQHSSAHTDINSRRQPRKTGPFSHLNPNYNSHTGAPENLFPKTEQARGRPAEGDWDKALSPYEDELWPTQEDVASNDPPRHTAELAGIGVAALLPLVRQRATSSTEITAPLSITPWPEGGEAAASNQRTPHEPNPHKSYTSAPALISLPDKRWLSVTITAPCHLVMSLCQCEASGKLKKP